MKANKSAIHILAGTVAALSSISVIAQEKAQRALEEIVVTAQKRAESLMDVPVAMSAYSGEELNNFGVDGVQSLQFSNPSVNYPNTGAFNQPYIRGVGSRLLMNGLDPSVATYFDNRYIARQSTAVFDLVDVERVEVLKGPQGVLFGRNSSAGAIRVISKAVSNELEGSISVGIGNYGARKLSGVVNVPISDAFGMRLSAISKTRDGYAENIVENAPIKEFDDEDFRAIRGKFFWDASDATTVDLGVSYWGRDDNSGNDIVALGPLQYHSGIASGGSTGKDVDEVATLSRFKNELEEMAFDLKISTAFDSFDFTAITTYATSENQLGFEGDGTSAIIVDTRIPELSDTFSQEFQFASSQSDSYEWLLGAFYFENDTDSFELELNDKFSQGEQQVITTAWALFGQVKWGLSERAALTVGGRYSAEEKELSLVSSSSPNLTTIPPTPVYDDVSWSKFTPRVTLDYNFDMAMLYFTYSRGFKSGGYNYPASELEDPLSPETLDMYELGLKGDFLENTLRFSASLYYYDYQDLQVTRAAAEGSAVVFSENAANAKLTGLDADINWLVGDALTINAGISLQDSKYEDYLASAKVFNGVLNNDNSSGMSNVGFDAGGETLLRAPKVAGFVSATYEFATSNAAVPVTLSYSYKGDYDFDFSIDPSTKVLQQDAYSLVSAKVAYIPHVSSWDVALWANNITNTEYYSDVVAAGNGIRGSYGAPRTFGIDVNYKF